MSVHPSGAQHEIHFGDQRAVVVEVGAALREYTWAGREVVQGFDIGSMCDGGHGSPLIPWPNRLADGRYSWEGQQHQVALTEPDRHNAIHGLLRWRSWQPAHRWQSRVVMSTRIHPMPGYPFTLDVEVDYELSAGGLSVTTRATNHGDRAAPYVQGHHPYLSPGAGAVLDECVLQLEAGTQVQTDPVRLLPTGVVPVAGTPYDFAKPRSLRGLAVDVAFGELARDDAGRAWVRLTGPDGVTASLWAEESFGYLQVFSGDGLAPARARRGMAAEPMTAPPNALATGVGVTRLEPGASVQTVFGMGLE